MYANIYFKLKNQYSFLKKQKIKTNSNTTKKKTKKGILQGEYVPKNKEKFIIIKNKQNSGKIKYRSSWELKFLEWCDKNTKITKIISEGIKIPYTDFNGKKRNYFPDFLIEYNNEKILIEIKPKNQILNETNQKKFEAAKKFCKKYNIKFLILTEIELKNLISK